jgi:hypothetical protein
MPKFSSTEKAECSKHQAQFSTVWDGRGRSDFRNFRVKYSQVERRAQPGMTSRGNSRVGSGIARGFDRPILHDWIGEAWLRRTRSSPLG